MSSEATSPDGERPSAAADDVLAHAPVGLAVLRQGLPLALGMASHAMVNLVDLALVGHLGAEAVAAAHVATTVNFLPMIVGNGLTVVAMAVMSQALGLGDRAAAASFALASTRFLLWLGLWLGVFTAALAAPCVDSTLVTGGVRADAIHYLVVSNLGCLPMFALMQATAVMRAAGEIAMPLLLLIGTNVVNLVAGAALLYGFEPLAIPSIGVVGAAYAAVAARVLGGVIALWWIWRSRHPLSLQGARSGPRLRVAWPLLGGAWPQSLQIVLRAGLVWGLTTLVQHRLGDAGTAALGVTTRLDTVVLFAGIGFASAATTVSGRAVAAGQTFRARASGVHAAVQALLFGGLIVAGFQLAAEPLLHLFLKDPAPAVITSGVQYLTIAAAALPFTACALGAMGAVHGAGRMIAPLMVDLVGFFALGLALLLVVRLPLSQVYWVLVGGAVLLALLHLWFVVRARWPHPVARC